MTFTDTFGIPFEYNSPTYYSVAFRSFKNLASLTRDPDTRIRARTAIARLGLSVALHIHTRTGRWAGPHSRAYHPTVVAETAPEAGMVRNWIDEIWIGDNRVPSLPADIPEGETIVIASGKALFAVRPLT